MRRTPVSLLALVLLLGLVSVHGQDVTTKKPPVGVPPEAAFFSGKWYHVYLERMSWRNARDKCKRLGGQLAVVPDEATSNFLRELAVGVDVWLGATDEKVESVWLWVDGSKMTYKDWAENEPGNVNGREHFLILGKQGAWHDGPHDKEVNGYICEWKDR